jgi:hypothetical protein
VAALRRQEASDLTIAYAHAAGFLDGECFGDIAITPVAGALLCLCHGFDPRVGGVVVTAGHR